MGVDLDFTRTETKYPYMKHDTAIIAKGETLTDILPGSSIHAIAWIKNNGDTGGYATLQIYNNTDSKYEAESLKTWVPANTDDDHAVQRSCTMTMPGHDVDDIELEVVWEEAAEKRWIQDTEKTFHLEFKPLCAFSLDPSRLVFEIGEIVTIEYTDVPTGSTLSIYPVGETGGSSWTVGGDGSETYTFKEDDPTGAWKIWLYDTKCLVGTEITVTPVPTKAEMVWLDKDNGCLQPHPAEPEETVRIRQWLDELCVGYREVKNEGGRADTPHFKLLVGGEVLLDQNDPNGSLAAGSKRTVDVSFTAPDTEGDHDVVFKVWAKTDESEP